jgi:diguanylate cyclase (GGDEF)-like protein/PAS domain S-box-containing protein
MTTDSRTNDIAALRESEAKARAREKMLTARHEIAQAFLTLSGDEVYHHVLEVVRGMLDSPLGFFGYIDEAGHLVCPSLTREVWKQCQMPEKRYTFAMNEWKGMWGRSLVEKTSLVANQGLSVPAGHLPLTRALVAPVVDGDVVVGQLVVGNRDTDYSDLDVALLESFCDSVAPILRARRDTRRLNAQRGEALDALRRSEVQYRALFDGADDTILLLEAEGAERGRIVAANLASAGMLGYTVEELTEMSVMDFTADTSIAVAVSTLERLESDGQVTATLDHVHRDGHVFPVEITARPLDLGDRRLIVAFGRDVSARQRAEIEYGTILHTSTDGFWVCSMEGRLLEVNDALCRMLGYTKDELLTMSIMDIEAAETPEETAAHIRRVVEQGSDRFESQHRRKDGVEIHVEISASYLPDLGGRFIVFSHDISDRKRQQLALARARDDLEEHVAERTRELVEAYEEQRKLTLAVEQFADWTIITDPRGLITYANDAVVHLSGFARAELVGQRMSVFRSGKQSPELYQKLWQTIRAGEVWRSVMENRAKDGSLFLLDMTIQSLKDERGQIDHFVMTAKDVTQEKAYEERLHRLANFDSLTELPNRRLFVERLSQACARTSRQDRMVAVVVLNLDRFKRINDSLGYQLGDEVLQEVARRLTAALREGDIVARLGTDEFGVALVDVDSVEDVVLVVEKQLIGVLQAPIAVGGEEAVATASAGITVLSAERADARHLLEDAYAALERAKKLGGNNYKFHEPGMNDRVVEFVKTQRRLVDALAGSEYVLHYQPYVALDTGRPAGMEALLRWRQPDGSLVPPGRFIPVLEETGMILEVGRWIISEAARQIQAWQMAGVPVVPVSVNLSPIQFRDRSLAPFIQETMKEAGVAPDLLVFEITESTFMDDITHSQQVLQDLQDLGHAISVDDFGTGYSSLAYLKSLPVDNLKIDISFVRDLLNDPESASIVRAIIQMAQGLELKTIAEGVEEEAQYDLLRTLHCDFVQGYYKARPTPADQISALLERLTPPTAT